MTQEPSRSGIARRLLRWLVRGVLVVAVLMAAVALIAFVLEARAAARDAREFPPTGSLVDVGGRSLHLDCRGEGAPVVVIDAGAQDWSTGWQRPQAALAEHTRACTYDRAGLGWSDPSDDPKDGLHMVADLHRLLEHAGVERPVVLAGHSLGGMLNQLYYQQYPDDVAGMVLLEPGDPDQLDAMFPDAGGEPAFGSWVDGLAGLVARLGLVRFLYRDLFESRDWPEREIAESRVLLARPAMARALASSIRHLPVTNAQTRAVSTLGEIPLRVVYSSKFHEYGAVFDSEEERQEFITESIASWERLAGSSTRGRPPVVIEGGNHLTLVRDDRYWPQATEVILQVVAEVRQLERERAVPVALSISNATHEESAHD